MLFGETTSVQLSERREREREKESESEREKRKERKENVIRLHITEEETIQESG